MDDAPKSSPEKSTGGWLLRSLRWMLGNKYFMLAAGIMLFTCIMWDRTIIAMEWVTHKEPVPWPAGVKVDQDSRLVSLATRVGPFVRPGDGELWNQVGALNKDGIPDGENILTQDVLESLGMNSSADRERLPLRSSNWYVSRSYRDTRPGVSRRQSLWRVDVTFYTGGLDTVPHVPDRCLAAAGAKGIGSETITVVAPSGVPEPWRGELDVVRTRYERPDDLGLMSQHFVQYYIFSINGRPESSWKQVRLSLTNPLTRHCYFAKIQIAPRFVVVDQDQTDAAFQDIMNHFLPRLLRLMPMPKDVRALDEARIDPAE